MSGDFMTCMAMFGNGVRTGMKNILQLLQLIRKGLHWALAGCAAMAAITTAPATAVQRIATTIRRATATTPWAFAFPGRFFSFWFFTFWEKSGGVHKIRAKRSRTESCEQP